MSVLEKNRTCFKETQIGNIPEDWEVVTYQDISKRLTYGFTNPMPTTEDGPWMVTAANICEGRINYSDTRQTSQEAFDKLLTDKSRPCIGDVLITKDGTLGRVAIVDRERICVNQSVAVIQPDYSRVSSEFLAWSLQSPQMQDRLINEAGGSTIKHIYITKLARTPVALPPLSEQEQIVTILNSVDEAIASTQAVINQTRKVKQGLLQQLLTRGIGHTKFKESAIGKIPEEWEVVTLLSLIQKKPENGCSPKASSSPPGVPTFSIAAVRNGRVKIKEHLKFANVPLDEVERFQLKAGDILVVRGNANIALVGTCGVVQDFPEGCIYPDILMRMRTNELVDLNFLIEVWNSKVVRKQVLEKAKSTNGTYKLNQDDVSSLLLPLPPMLEQQRILSILDSINQEEKALEDEFVCLKVTKRGLIQDLLTGRVRFKDTLSV